MPGRARRARELPRFKRAATLTAYWQNGDLICENYRTRSRTVINPRGIELLEYFRDWQTGEECSSRFPEYSGASILRSIEEMVALGLLVREGSRQSEADGACELAWSRWLPHAGFLHMGTKDIDYAETEDEFDSTVAGMLEAGPPPPFSKAYARAASVKLPKPAVIEKSFLDVLLKRRTHRSFSPESLRLDHLSALLYYTWGATGYLEVPQFGRMPLKTSPSGGGRHPEEVYVAALRVKGLKRGLYHYAADRHILQPIAQAAGVNSVVKCCAGQPWVGGAAALFIMTAVFARTMWKYPVPRAYRVVLAEAGHLCQTFCLIACSLGLGPFCTMALKDSLIESDLGLNGFDESVLYVAGVGSPPAS